MSKPAYRLTLTDKGNSKRKTQVGVAFAMQSGGLNVVLNPGVVLDWHDQGGFWLALFPYDGYGPTPSEGSADDPRNDEEPDFP